MEPSLSEYLQAERGRVSRVAAETGLAPAMLSQIAAGLRPIPVRRAAALEAATGFAVRRWAMFPDDWHLIWPELADAEGAPELPTKVAA